MRLILLLLYYCFAIHLPSSSIKIMKIGFISMKIRAWIASKLFLSCGRGVNIEKGANFGDGKQIVIGDRSGIGRNCTIPNDTKIGNDVMIAPDVVIFNHNHRYSSIDVPMNQQGIDKINPVSIESDVWIGQRVIILSGVTVGKGSIVAAGSVVTRSVMPHTIVGGNPAKIIKSRVKSSLES